MNISDISTSEYQIANPIPGRGEVLYEEVGDARRLAYQGFWSDLSCF